MDDLLGEDWQSAPKQSSAGQQSNKVFAADFASLRPSPQPVASASTSPLNLSRPSSTVPGSSSRPASTTPKPAGDAFGGLVGLKSGKTAASANVSLQERQRQLVEERQRQLQEQGKLWDSLGSGKTNTGSQKTIAATRSEEDEDDILAAFNKDVKVDNASHFPPPVLPSSQPTSGRGTPVFQQSERQPASSRQQEQNNGFADDDDTFGLGSLAVKSNGHVKSAPTTDDDDILGELGRPVSTKPVAKAPPQDASSGSDGEWDENVAKSRSRAHEPPPADGPLAELVEMGFPEDSARIALAQNGGNVQEAVGWLLRQAHEESKQKAQERQDGSQGDRRRDESAHLSDRRGRGADAHSTSRNGSRDQERPTNGAGDKDAAQMAQDFGNKLFKSANSLWKASQKQMAKTMAEFQQERDPSQPKWMQSSSNANSRDASQRPARESPSSVTNEAALLDMPRNDAPARTTKPARPTDASDLRATSNHSPVYSARSTPQPFQDRRPAAKLTRQAVEEQSAQAYVSPARRRKAAPPQLPQAETPPATITTKDEPEVDLFSSPAPVQKQPEVASKQRVAPTPSPRPSAPARSSPSVSPAALSTSAGHRKKGTDAFKLGDYAKAHEAYTAALTPLPQTHPLVIIILSNRSLTALKTGDPKTAVSDADRALDLIGPGLGAGESIDVDGDSKKDMREFYGKALMRKAEALEHMEKWRDAGAVWRLAVEAGVGGAISIRGKDRCDRAVAPKPAAATPVDRTRKTPAPTKARSTTSRPAAPTQSSTDAVRKLREANAAAEKADDEKFQLADQVEARLTAWKGGKADNLRALLQSMDTVLWSDAGWKKVGMSDLVMANKVKIIYMKAIAKVHPDKIAPDASTEQRMISTAVFSTLNEAWDKFKKDNNL